MDLTPDMTRRRLFQMLAGLPLVGRLAPHTVSPPTPKYRIVNVTRYLDWIVREEDGARRWIASPDGTPLRHIQLPSLTMEQLWDFGVPYPTRDSRCETMDEAWSVAEPDA